MSGAFPNSQLSPLYPKDYPVFRKMQVFTDPAFRRTGPPAKLGISNKQSRQYRSSNEIAKLYQDNCK